MLGDAKEAGEAVLERTQGFLVPGMPGTQGRAGMKHILYRTSFGIAAWIMKVVEGWCSTCSCSGLGNELG